MQICTRSGKLLITIVGLLMISCGGGNTSSAPIKPFINFSSLSDDKVREVWKAEAEYMKLNPIVLNPFDHGTKWACPEGYTGERFCVGYYTKSQLDSLAVSGFTLLQDGDSLQQFTSCPDKKHEITSAAACTVFSPTTNDITITVAGLWLSDFALFPENVLDYEFGSVILYKLKFDISDR